MPPLDLGAVEEFMTPMENNVSVSFLFSPLDIIEMFLVSALSFRARFAQPYCRQENPQGPDQRSAALPSPWSLCQSLHALPDQEQDEHHREEPGRWPSLLILHLSRVRHEQSQAPL